MFSERAQFWDIYNTICEVESTFRCLKTNLHIRPIRHEKDERVKMTILNYQLVNTIRYVLKKQNINYDLKNILRILKTHHTKHSPLQLIKTDSYAEGKAH